MQADNQIAGKGGSYSYNSTDAYISNVGNKRAINHLKAFGSAVISVLEVNGTDELARRGLSVGYTFDYGEELYAEDGRSFTKIQFSTAAKVVFNLD